MTLILVYMGNPDRMKNPHLRAELAETLAMLLPNDQEQNRALMSRYMFGKYINMVEFGGKNLLYSRKPIAF